MIIKTLSDIHNNFKKLLITYREIPKNPKSSVTSLSWYVFTTNMQLSLKIDRLSADLIEFTCNLFVLYHNL